MVQKDDTSQRTQNYMAQMSFMEHQGSQPSSFAHEKSNFNEGKEHQAQTQTHLMDPSTSEASHSFAQQEMHHDEQVQRVVSPASHASMAHFQAHYPAYESHH